jgi:hypothetical protein
MRKPKKSAKGELIGKEPTADPDELQLFDEFNSEWVDAWKAAAEKKGELDVYVFREDIDETKLVEAPEKKSQADRK